MNASDLAPNDVVYTKDWNTATVKSVNLLELDEPIEVFNFEVEDCHTYFVGDLYILVHNGTCTNTKTKWDINKYSKGEVKTSYKSLNKKIKKIVKKIDPEDAIGYLNQVTNIRFKFSGLGFKFSFAFTISPTFLQAICNNIWE